MIGDLLVRSGLISSADLTEAVQVMRRLQMPIGRVLTMSGNVTQEVFQTALEAQSLIRDGVVPLDVGIEALTAAATGGVSIQEALKKHDRAPQFSPTTNRLGELLVDAGIITKAQLDTALRVSLESGMPLGGTLVTQGVLHATLLPTVLRAQEQIRDGAVTRSDAVSELKAAMKIWAKAETSMQSAGYAHEGKMDLNSSAVIAPRAGQQQAGSPGAAGQQIPPQEMPQQMPPYANQAPPLPPMPPPGTPVYGYNTPYGHAPYGQPSGDQWGNSWHGQPPANPPGSPYGQAMPPGFNQPMPGYPPQTPYPPQQNPYGQGGYPPMDQSWQGQPPNPYGYGQPPYGAPPPLPPGHQQPPYQGQPPAHAEQNIQPSGQQQYPPGPPAQYAQSDAPASAPGGQMPPGAPGQPPLPGQYAQAAGAPDVQADSANSDGEAPPRLKNAAAQLASRLGWSGDRGQEAKADAQSALEQTSVESLPQPKRLQWTSLSKMTAQDAGDPLPEEASAEAPGQEALPLEESGEQAPRKLQWKALARTTMTGQPSISEVLARQPDIEKEKAQSDEDLDRLRFDPRTITGEDLPATLPPRELTGEPPSIDKDSVCSLEGSQADALSAENEEASDSTTSFMNEVFGNTDAQPSSSDRPQAQIVSFTSSIQETLPGQSQSIEEGAESATEGQAPPETAFNKKPRSTTGPRDPWNASSADTGFLLAIRPDEELTARAVEPEGDESGKEQADKGKKKSAQSQSKMKAAGKGKKQSASQNKMQSAGKGKKASQSHKGIPAIENDQKLEPGQEDKADSHQEVPGVEQAQFMSGLEQIASQQLTNQPQSMEEIARLTVQESITDSAPKAVAHLNAAEIEARTPSQSQTRLPATQRAASLSLSGIPAVTGATQPGQGAAMGGFPFGGPPPVATIVELLTLSGFFTKKDIVNALELALEDASLAPDLLMALGLVNEDTLDAVVRCQTLTRNRQITTEQSIYALGAVRAGRLTFDAALKELGIDT